MLFWSFARLFSPCDILFCVGQNSHSSPPSWCQHRRKLRGQSASSTRLAPPDWLPRDLLRLPSLLFAELEGSAEDGLGISKILQASCIKDSQRKLVKLVWLTGFGVGCVSAREDVFGRLVPWLQVSASSCAVLWPEMYLASGLSLLNRFQM